MKKKIIPRRYFLNLRNFKNSIENTNPSKSKTFSNTKFVLSLVRAIRILAENQARKKRAFLAGARTGIGTAAFSLMLGDLLGERWAGLIGGAISGYLVGTLAQETRKHNPLHK